MVKPLHNNGQAKVQDDKVVTSLGEMATRPDIRPELLLKLSGKLQTTLELSQLLEIFFNEIQQAVLVDGISFSHSGNNILLSYGRNSVHSASYRVQTQQDYVGDLTFHRSTRFREHELANIEGLLTTLVYPMRNALRYHEALAASFRDPLTGAGNRVALERTLTREIELTKRHGQNLSILMLDLDHFKLINDEFGHSMGDKVLLDTANCMIHCIRQTDMCFRYGGEEFLIMLSNAESPGALRIAERIRMSICALEFSNHKGKLQVSTSIGCVTMNLDDTMDSMIQRADDALYKAKHSGRNRVVCDTDEFDITTEHSEIL